MFGTIGAMEHVNFQGKTDMLILNESLLGAGITEKELNNGIDILKKKYFSYLEARIRENEITLLPGIREILEALDTGNGVLLGLLTGNFSEGARIKLSKFDLARHFKFGVFCDDTHIRNEMPGIARNKLRQNFNIHVDFSDMIVIGDTVHDIACGKFSGARTLAVGTGWTEKETLLRCEPDYYLDDLHDTEEVLRIIHSG